MLNLVMQEKQEQEEEDWKTKMKMMTFCWVDNFLQSNQMINKIDFINI